MEFLYNDTFIIAAVAFGIFTIVINSKVKINSNPPRQKNEAHIEWCGEHLLLRKRVNYDDIRIKTIDDA